MLKRLMVGVVTSTHGLKGEVNIFPTTDDPGRFESLKSVLLADADDAPSREVESVKYHKGRPILKLKGIDRIEDAERLKGTELYVRREDAIPLEEGEYYVGDLVGCGVFLEDGTQLGTLKDILKTGANGVYVIGVPEGKDVLLPAVPQFILSKDVEAKRITVRVLREI